MRRESLALNPGQTIVQPRRRTTSWTPDPKRVLAIAAAVSAHILVFGAMLLPSERRYTPSNPAPADFIYEAPTLPPPPERKLEPKITPKLPAMAVPRPQPVPLPEPKAIEVPVQLAALVAPAEEAEQVTIVEPPSTGGTAPTESVMQVIKAPAPHYPYDVLRKGISGTVEFRVLVNAQGVPEKVELLRSSGNRKLDQLSLSHIKRRWRFRAPEVDGVASSGWGRGKINFQLGQ